MDQISQKAKGKEKYIPEEIFFDIASRLPSKCVGRFTTVSKSWYAFIKSSAFIAAHLNQSIANNKGNNSSHYLLFIEPYAKDCYAYRDNTKSFDKLFSFKLPMDFESEIFRPIGSCNGLLCLTDDYDDSHGRVIYLWNPLIRKYKRITGTSCCRTMFYSRHTLVSVGFWYDDANHDYKLIRLVQSLKDNSSESSNLSQVELYSVNVGSWRKIDDAKPTGRIQTYRPPAFVDGTFYWSTYYYHGSGNTTFDWYTFSPSRSSDTGEFIILSFDTRTEHFQKVELPKYQEYPDSLELPYLVVYKGDLAFFVGPDSCLDGSDIWSIWVLNKPGEAKTWVKLITVETDENIRYPIGITENDEIILCTDECISMTYNLEKRMIRFLSYEFAAHSSWLNYTESLVFLDEGK